MHAELDPKSQLAYELLGSFTKFTRYFFKQRTGKTFVIPTPPGRQSHIRAIAEALTDVEHMRTTRLLINIPPRYSKTELCISWIAWSFSRNAACQFIYVSYGHSLAATQTNIVRQILQLSEYRRLFPWVKLSGDTAAKDHMNTTAGGSLYACGRNGSLTGRGAGIKGSNKQFAGAIIIDDILKPSEATSQVVRESANSFYYNTLLSRLNNGDKTALIFIGQRLHEDDLAQHLIDGEDGYDGWEKLIMPALDDNGYALQPDFHSAEYLNKLAKANPYTFSSQFQQKPTPAGGSVFKPEWFRLTSMPSNIEATFITVDCAETEKSYNDATVFSFWGVYKSVQDSIELPVHCLHWLDSKEIRVEPKDLLSEFLGFLTECRHFEKQPVYVYIEKASTGTTLHSVLSDVVGLINIPIIRNKTSKTERFLRSQPYVASGQVSITEGANHTDMCINHMKNITANNSHRHDDIADTLADAIQIALIDKSLPSLRKVTAPLSIEPIDNILTNNPGGNALSGAESYGLFNY